MSIFRISRQADARSSARTLVTSVAALATVAATMTTLSTGVAHAITPGEITSAGPLTTIGVTPDLNCYTRRLGDTDGEWFYGGSHGTPPGDTACGTFAVVGSDLYGPAHVPAGESATDAEAAAWTPVSQTGPTGTGTVASPYRLVTTVRAGGTGVTLTETDTYVAGQEGSATYIAVSNGSGAPVNVRVYHAGDCYLQNADVGYGVEDLSAGSAGCQAPVVPTTDPPVRGTRVEQMFPLTPGSAFLEAGFNTVWENIAAKTDFPNTCKCQDTDYIDNGVGLSWNAGALAVGATVQEGVYTSLSPTGIIPATTGNLADAPSVVVGSTSGYTVTVHNTGAGAIHLVGVTDTLPAGFSYVPNSTTGLTTTNPDISGQSLTWTVPSTVIAGHGSATLHFGFIAPATVGDYVNSASGTSTETVVVPAGPFSPLHVISVPGAPAPVTGIGGQARATVSWTAPGNIGNSAITGYDVQVTPAGRAPQLVAVVATAGSVVVPGLTPGVTYAFAVRAKNLAGAGAFSVPVTLAGTKLVMAKVSHPVTFGGSRTLKATLTSGGAPWVGARVTVLYRAKSNQAWHVLATTTTKARGVAKVKVKPSRGETYEWVLAGDGGHTGAITSRGVTVAPKLTLSLSHSRASVNGTVVASGKIAPGPVFAKQRVSLQKLVGKHWRTVGSVKLTKSGKYSFTLVTGARGTFRYRVAKGGGNGFVAGYSGAKSVRIS